VIVVTVIVIMMEMEMVPAFLPNQTWYPQHPSAASVSEIDVLAYFSFESTLF
jgi:hypothetical protein